MQDSSQENKQEIKTKRSRRSAAPPASQFLSGFQKKIVTPPDKIESEETATQIVNPAAIEAYKPIETQAGNPLDTEVSSPSNLDVDESIDAYVVEHLTAQIPKSIELQPSSDIEIQEDNPIDTQPDKSETAHVVMPIEDVKAIIEESITHLDAQVVMQPITQAVMQLDAQRPKFSNLQILNDLTMQGSIDITTQVDISKTTQALKSISPKQSISTIKTFMQLNAEMHNDLITEVSNSAAGDAEVEIDKRTKAGSKKKGRIGAGYRHLSCRIQVPIHRDLEELAIASRRDMVDITEDALLIYMALYRKAMQAQQ